MLNEDHVEYTQQIADYKKKNMKLENDVNVLTENNQNLENKIRNCNTRMLE